MQVSWQTHPRAPTPMLCNTVSHYRTFLRAVQDQQLPAQGRFFTVLILQQESFQQNSFSAACLLVHVLLHALSFQFELPRNRIWTKPMIWREFRVHNALFAMRHLIGTALGIWAPDWWLRQPGVAAVAAKVCLTASQIHSGIFPVVQLTSCVAAHDEDDRTTNAMPYPKKTPETLEKVAKRFYAKSQFAATALAVSRATKNLSWQLPCCPQQSVSTSPTEVEHRVGG
eukprot:s1234_g6.t1